VGREEREDRRGEDIGTPEKRWEYKKKDQSEIPVGQKN
jgi:hypothetical protein